MTADARKRAERCFALARSTTFAGERDNAVAMGTRIAEEAGLDLDLFDIPGRPRSTPRPSSSRMPPPPSSRYTDDLFRRPKAPPEYTRDELRDVMERFRRHMAEAERAANARTGESAYDARRRNFDEETRAARERDRKHNRRKRIDDAAAELWTGQTAAYPNDAERESWTVQLAEGLAECTADELIELGIIARLKRLEAMAARFTNGVPRSCPGCGRAILFGDSCVECDRAGRI